MRHSIRLAIAAVAAAAALTAGAAGTASAHDGGKGRGHAPRTEYYVSLGDSLAAGYQPDVDHDTSIAYTDQLYTALKKTRPGLKHVKLGCSGETTTSLLDGGKCTYPNAKSQLDAATKFLRAHRGSTAFVTLDIGANDILGCTRNGLDQACIADAMTKVATNSAKIDTALRRAGGGRPEYAGMTYYNPLLAVWLSGAGGQQFARQSAGLLTAFNGVLTASYRAAGFRVAEVDDAFRSDDFTDTVTLPGVGEVPVNVGDICTRTWMCTSYEDIHPTPAGHTVIAGVFEKTLAVRGRR